VVRNAGLDALRFVADFPAPEEFDRFEKPQWFAGKLRSVRPGWDVHDVTIWDLVRLPRVQLTVRLSADSDVRSLHVSVECDQYRPLRPVDEKVAQHLERLVPQHSADAVGGRVYRSLEAATRSGVEPHGEVWAHFEEPRVVDGSVPRPVDGDEPAESPNQVAGDLEAKRRVVERLYDDHHVRLLGWGTVFLL